MFERLQASPRPRRARRIGAILFAAACVIPSALPPAGIWPQQGPVSLGCSFSGTSQWSQDSVYLAFSGAVKRARLVPLVADAQERRLVLAGPTAPAYRGSEALRRSRVHLEFGVSPERTEDGRTAFYVVEGSSMRPDALTHQDSLQVLQQTSEWAQKLAKSARLGRAGCWVGAAKPRARV